ncbi:MAG: hypothetical protein KatS3mg016_1645 [Fimbriimonadales bacterium]|nr:MAG: hypothetical protein KatS3mg016_1645 [Fimbriimonadales bacterium]
MSWLTPEYRAVSERYAPRFIVLSGVCMLMVLMAWLGIGLRGLERAQHPNALANSVEAYLRSGQYQLVNWQPCNAQAIRQAQTRDRLIMIEVGAYWSGRCQRLGYEAFSDSGVADLVNREFVAIKLDADAAPKRARYIRQLAQLHGAPDRYPIIAWFTPDGKPVRAVAPDTRAELMRHLEELSQLYRNRPEQIQQLAEPLERAWNDRWARSARLATLDADAIAAEFLEALAASDSAQPPNAPMFDLNHLETLLALAEAGNVRARERLLAQLIALSQSLYWDSAQKSVYSLTDGLDAEGKPTGGKRLIEQARLLSLYSRASRWEPELTSFAHELAEGLRRNFYRERPAGFIGALPPPKLRIAIAQSLGMPRADNAFYVDGNAYAIIALVDYVQALGTQDPRGQWALETAPRVLETLRALRTLRGDLFHSSLRQTSDWMTDLALAARAAVRVHQLQPNPRALQFARQLLQHIWRDYADPTGGFYDIARSKAWDMLKVVPVRMSRDETLPADNALLGMAMDEYARASGERLWRARAEQLAQVIAGDYSPTETLQYGGCLQLLTRLAERP